MSKYANATLGGFKLLASSPVRWTFREGVAPTEETFDMIPGDAKKLLALGRLPTVLVIDDKERKLEVKRLWVVSEIQGDNPHVARVRVVDRRFWLPYFNFLGRFNMRRNVGFNRVGDNVTQQLNPVVPDLWYWLWSLKTKPNGKWKASEIVEEFMSQLQLWEGVEGVGTDIGYSLGSLRTLDSVLNVDNLNLDESGDAALQRLLSIYPNAGVYIDKAGKYIFFDRNDGGENTAVKQLGPLVVGGGQFKLVDNKFQRPVKIEVYFSMEVEVRHDFLTTRATSTGLVDERVLENVAPVPDFSLEVDGINYAQHSWLAIRKMLTSSSWSNHPGAGGGALSQTILEKAAMPYLDLWGALLITGVRQPDANWAARVAILQQHWRRTFQISPAWMSRTLSIKARRAALIDPATGTWAPSEAFCNHSFLGTVRSFFKNRAEGKGLQYAINVEGYPTGDQVPGLSSPTGAKKFGVDSKAAPVIVKVVDGDQGIITLNFQAEPNHIYEVALPGRVVRADGSPYTPTADWQDPNQAAVGFDLVTTRAQVPKLESDWKCAVILSHVPASPNDKRQLYKVTVRPKDVQDRFAAAARKALVDGAGPTWQIRVGAGMDGAKAIIRWSDNRAPDIEAIFGITDAEPQLSSLVVNHQPNGPGKQPAISLQEIANGLAAQLWSRFIDHQEGGGTGYINPEIQPTGWIGAVSHVLTPKGELLTQVQMAGAIQELNLLSMLDSSTRAILLKLPHVDRQ